MRLRGALVATLVASLLAAAPAARGQDPVVGAAGDVACGPADVGVRPCREMQTSDALLSFAPDEVLALGDLQYNSGRLSEFLQFYDPSWGRLKSITHPVVGNHEYGQSSAAGYFDYFNGVGGSDGPAGPRPEGWYSFDIGAWHVVALNSNCEVGRAPGGCAAGSPQERWLRADLAAHRTRCTLAIWHHPLWASDNGASRTPAVLPLYQALYDFRADLLLVGHAHTYERFAPSRPTQAVDAASGIRQITVGTGGRDLGGFGPTQPNSQVRQNSTFGVLRLTLRPTSYSWQFVPEAGGTFSDSGTTTCSPAAPLTPPPPPPPAPPPPPPPPGGPPVPPGDEPTAPDPPVAPATVSAAPAAAPVAPAALQPATAAALPSSAGLSVTSVRFGPTSVIVRGTFAPGVNTGRLRVTVTRNARHLRLRLVRGVEVRGPGRWRAIVRLSKRARRLGSLRITVRHLGDRTVAAETIQLIARRSSRGAARR